MTYWRHAARVLMITLALVLTPLTAPSTGSTPATAGATASPALVKQTRPNIVVIMADDMRRDDLRWMPKTRRLVGAQGARFANSFAPYPLCCPARASFLTGQYTHNHKVWSHKPPYGFHAFRDRRTLPVWLRGSGYRTMFLGKYLNGYGKRPTPAGGSSLRYVPPGWTDWRGSIDGGLPKGHPKAGGTYHYRDTTLNVNGRLQGHQGQYQTRMLGNQSVRLVGRYAKSDRPFFLWASYVAPHHGGPREDDDPRPVRRNDGEWTEIVTPAVTARARGRFNDRIRRPAGLPAERDVSDKPNYIQLPPINKRERRAMLEAARQRAEALWVLDTQVARTIQALRDAGELRRTLLMFTSDNGYFQGEHRRRQGKTLPYEPALRTPMLMRGPAIPRGVTRTAPFLTIDFAPTILKAAGAQLGASIDGQPLLGAARNGGGGWARGVLTETGPGSADPSGVRPKSAGVRTSHYLYVHHLSGAVELYDMRRDPAQLRNVANEESYATAQRRLARILRDLRECAGSECRRPLSSW